MCLIVFLGELGYQMWASRAWRSDLLAFRLRLPSDLDIDDVSRALSVLSGSTRRRPLVFEINASPRGIGHFLLVPSTLGPRAVTMLSATLPGIRVEEDGEYLKGRPAVRLARELRSSRAWRPLAADRGTAAIAGVLSILYPLGPGEVVRVQWTIRATRHIRLKGDASPAMVRDFREKQSYPLLDACGRVAVSAPEKARAALLMSGVLAGMGALSAPGTALVRRFLPSAYVAGRVYPRSLPLIGAWPCLLNAAEAAALIGFPTNGLSVPGLATGSARALPAPVEMRNTGLVVAESNYPGMRGRVLTLQPDDRLRHTTIQAPTGAGKSELMANMILQDIEAGYGVAVLDPKSDLISDVLARIPEHRVDDVILMDPSAVHSPVGFNLLQGGRDELSRELVVDRVVHIFAQLWRSSWGPRTADVVRNALLTLVAAKAPDGSAYTLVEIPELLTNDEFRRTVLRNARIGSAVRQFWATYDTMSEAERIQVTGPTMNKLRAFTVRTPLRLMLGQSEGVDLGSIFRKGKVLLVPLSKGVIGPEAAMLLGSLIVASLWQECLNRTTIPKHLRRPVWGYLDEFPDILKFAAGRELADILAQARGLGWGLTLAYQYLDQLTPEIESAILGTVRTQICFQMEYGDANQMARRFAPMDRSDLAGLGAYEIAMRPCIGGRTVSPVTGKTFELPESHYDPALVAAHVLKRHGIDRSAIEESITERLTGNAREIGPPHPYGQGRKGGEVDG
ncbi:type IV secretory system conjugative DNA transfer family protein [Actinomadura harenae]|uniref:type IV secretory system conjugative DNA transfer family protein n=1 Tax=Actinomadura harenae TaxID=2483351 RepID=UPI0036717E4E